jgi:hypothetical protein
MTPDLGLLVLGAMLLALVMLVAAGVMLLRRKRVLPACAVLGAVAGMVVALVVFRFVTVLSDNNDYAFVSFGVIGQRVHHPLLEYTDGRQAESDADLLTCGLGLAGAAVGAAVGLGVGWRLCKR